MEVWWQGGKDKECELPQRELQILRLIEFSAFVLSYQRPLPISSEAKGREGRVGVQGRKIHSHHCISNVVNLKIKIQEDSKMKEGEDLSPREDNWYENTVI